MKRYLHTAVEKRRKLKPLVKFDADLVKSPLNGILTNIDRDLERRARKAQSLGAKEARRQLTLLHVMIRIASNSYSALSFLQSDADDDPKRKPNFVLVAPPVNRQLIDLLFTLVYMRDDFGPRSLAYERAGWRAFREQFERLNSRFGKLREWKRHLAAHKQLANLMAADLGISTVDKRDPGKINRWKGPFKLSQIKSMSQPFLQWMEEWIYDDVSAQAHLTGVGLFMVSPFLLSDMVTDDMRELIEGRSLHQYRAQHFLHTLMIVLALATEIDAQFNLQNHTRIAYVWRILCEWSPDAKDMFTNRYEAILAKA